MTAAGNALVAGWALRWEQTLCPKHEAERRALQEAEEIGPEELEAAAALYSHLRSGTHEEREAKARAAMLRDAVDGRR